MKSPSSIDEAIVKTHFNMEGVRIEVSEARRYQFLFMGENEGRI